MAAPSPEAARKSIEAVVGRIGPVQESSFRITNVTASARLGVTVNPYTLAGHLDVNYEGEIESCVTYRHESKATVRIYAT